MESGVVADDAAARTAIGKGVVEILLCIVATRWKEIQNPKCQLVDLRRANTYASYLQQVGTETPEAVSVGSLGFAGKVGGISGDFDAIDKVDKRQGRRSLCGSESE